MNKSDIVAAKVFKYPSQLKTMTVERAFLYLDTARCGHDYIYSDYTDFLRNLVVKCNVDKNYVFGLNFEEDIEKVKSHIVTNVEQNIEDIDQLCEAHRESVKKEQSIKSAKQRYKELTLLKKILVSKPNDKTFSSKTSKEINEMYVGKKI